METNTSGSCGCGHHKIMPLAIVLFGLTFLLGSLNILTAGAVNIIWPVLVIIVGLKKLMKGSCGCGKK